MSQVDKTIAQYKEFSQLQEFATAQQTTIVQLSKKIQRLEEERDHLKQLLEQSVPLLNADSEIKQFAGEDAEYICNIEIGKLKQVSIARELTLEEARRLETYFKILTQIQNKNKKAPEREVKDLTTEDLLKLVDSDDAGTK